MSRRILFPAIFLAACGPGAPVETPFEGPGLDPATGRLVAQEAPLIVGITELHVKNAPGPGKRFGEHADAVGTWVFEEEPDGFVGGSFRNVGKLQWWTMTVWTSEEAMTAFVLSDVHVDAMMSLTDVAAAARSTHVEIEAGAEPPSWEWALDQLEATDWLVGE